MPNDQEDVFPFLKIPRFKDSPFPVPAFKDSRCRSRSRRRFLNSLVTGMRTKPFIRGSSRLIWHSGVAVAVAIAVPKTPYELFLHNGILDDVNRELKQRQRRRQPERQLNK